MATYTYEMLYYIPSKNKLCTSKHVEFRSNDSVEKPTVGEVEKRERSLHAYNKDFKVIGLFSSGIREYKDGDIPTI